MAFFLKKSVLNVKWNTFLCFCVQNIFPNITFILLTTVNVTILKGLVYTYFLSVAVYSINEIKKRFLVEAVKPITGSMFNVRPKPIWDQPDIITSVHFIVSWQENHINPRGKRVFTMTETLPNRLCRRWSRPKKTALK